MYGVSLIIDFVLIILTNHRFGDDIVVPMYLNKVSPQKLAGSMGTLLSFISQIIGLDFLLSYSLAPKEKSLQP